MTKSKRKFPASLDISPTAGGAPAGQRRYLRTSVFALTSRKLLIHGKATLWFG
jgi:hypothetical protein